MEKFVYIRQPAIQHFQIVKFLVGLARKTLKMYRIKPLVSRIFQKNYPYCIYFSNKSKILPPSPKTKEYSTPIKTALIIGGAFVSSLGLFTAFYQLGKPLIDEEGKIVQDQFIHLPIWQQYLFRSLKQLQEFAVIIQEPSRDKLLPDPLKYPYYQPAYTVVIELTDVLVHPEWTYMSGWRFRKRPGIDYLLESLVGLFEIVIFTAEPGVTIFPIIDAIDPKNCISYKLVRDSTHFVDGHHVKNLTRLNRDLSKVIVVDWNAESLKLHPDNHLQIKRYKGEDGDNSLIDLVSFLKTIAVNQVEDVRDVLKFYKQYKDPLEAFRQKQAEYYEMQEQAVVSTNIEKLKKARFRTLLSHFL